MDRTADTFRKLKAAGRKGLVGYLTAGDPDVAGSARDLRAALDAGVDVLELGVPFSDPTADGPTIQAASQRALAARITLPKVLDLVRDLRRTYVQPIVLFGYANPFYVYGYERLCRDAAAAGVDGLLVVDLPFEEQEELRRHMRPQGLALIPLIAPTTPPDRAARLLQQAEGFVYYIMVKGVTGERRDVPADIRQHLDVLRQHTALPIAAGFGIGSGAQAREAAAVADAVVVGSALVKAARAGRLAEFVHELRAALD